MGVDDEDVQSRLRTEIGPTALPPAPSGWCQVKITKFDGPCTSNSGVPLNEWIYDAHTGGPKTPITLAGCRARGYATFCGVADDKVEYRISQARSFKNPAPLCTADQRDHSDGHCPHHMKNGGCMDANDNHTVWRARCPVSCGICILSLPPISSGRRLDVLPYLSIGDITMPPTPPPQAPTVDTGTCSIRDASSLNSKCIANTVTLQTKVDIAFFFAGTATVQLGVTDQTKWFKAEVDINANELLGGFFTANANLKFTNENGSPFVGAYLATELCFTDCDNPVDETNDLQAVGTVGGTIVGSQVVGTIHSRTEEAMTGLSAKGVTDPNVEIGKKGKMTSRFTPTWLASATTLVGSALNVLCDALHGLEGFEWAASICRSFSGALSWIFDIVGTIIGAILHALKVAMQWFFDKLSAFLGMLGIKLRFELGTGLGLETEFNNYLDERRNSAHRQRRLADVADRFGPRPAGPWVNGTRPSYLTKLQPSYSATNISDPHARNLMSVLEERQLSVATWHFSLDLDVQAFGFIDIDFQCQFSVSDAQFAALAAIAPLFLQYKIGECAFKALAGADQFLGQAIDTMQDFMGSIGSEIANAASQLFKWAEDALNSIAAAAADIATAVFYYAKKVFDTSYRKLEEGLVTLGDYTEKIYGEFQNIAVLCAELSKGCYENLASAALDVANLVAGKLGINLSAVASKVVTTISNAYNAVKAVVEDFFSDIGDVLSDIGNSLCPWCRRRLEEEPDEQDIKIDDEYNTTALGPYTKDLTGILALRNQVDPRYDNTLPWNGDVSGGPQQLHITFFKSYVEKVFPMARGRNFEISSHKWDIPWNTDPEHAWSEKQRNAALFFMKDCLEWNTSTYTACTIECSYPSC